DRFLWLGCLLYAVLFTALGWLKYAVHRNLVDFGIFSQTAASAFGCFCNPIEGSHWAYHFSPILYVVGIVVTLFHSPLTLVALQAVAGALVAPPVYGLVRARRDVTAARLAALVAWLYPPLAGLIFGDFHENGLAPAAIAWTLYAFDTGLVLWTVAGAVIALCIKEDQALFLAVGGAIGAWTFRGTMRGRVAAVIALLSAAVLIAFFAVVQPHAAVNAAISWQPERFYAWSAADTRGIAGGMAARLGFLLLIFVPLLFLPFRSPMIWLAVAPLAEVLLSRMPTTFTLGTHYAGAWIGYVLVAFAFAARRILTARVSIVLLACAVLCVLELAVADPLHPGMNLRRVEPRDVALDRFLNDLPPATSLATQEEAYTHLALFDPGARLLPESPDRPIDACYVLIDRDFPASARLQEYGAALSADVLDGRYVRVARNGEIELYRSSDRRCH
ncbi:MAG: DUF2079 domain-containing protein, partial [Candidatus Eremiobacteraeota bacterium]|nr:DUF2079 domain-containing protein [Candidatus Eremiobacteraeota bacterium]